MGTVPKLQEGESEQFSYQVGQCGPGLCEDTQVGFRKWIPFLAQHPDVEYRVAITDHRCVVFVRPADALESFRNEHAEKQKKAIAHFWKLFPVNAIVTLLLAFVFGGAFTVAALVLSSVFGLKPNLLYAFCWGFGITAVLRVVVISFQYVSARTS